MSTRVVAALPALRIVVVMLAAAPGATGFGATAVVSTTKLG
jgi:hypothetical protein